MKTLSENILRLLIMAPVYVLSGMTVGLLMSLFANMLSGLDSLMVVGIIGWIGYVSSVSFRLDDISDSMALVLFLWGASIQIATVMSILHSLVL